MANVAALPAQATLIFDWTLQSTEGYLPCNNPHIRLRYGYEYQIVLKGAVSTIGASYVHFVALNHCWKSPTWALWVACWQNNQDSHSWHEAHEVSLITSRSASSILWSKEWILIRLHALWWTYQLNQLRHEFTKVNKQGIIRKLLSDMHQSRKSWFANTWVCRSAWSVTKFNRKVYEVIAAMGAWWASPRCLEY